MTAVVSTGEGGILSFRCPACDDVHQIRVGSGDGPRWTWNDDVAKPTFKPSVLVRSGHYAGHFKPGEECWCTYNREHSEEPADFHCYLCHSFVTDGRIQYLGDCTHAMAGQTVDLPAWPA